MAFKTAQQLEAEGAERLSRSVREAREDHARRLEGARKFVFGRLAIAPEERSAGQNRIISFRVLEEGRDRPMSAVLFVPPHQRVNGFGRDDLDGRVSALREGDEVSLAGHWTKRKWQDRSGAAQESWEFSAQFFGAGKLRIDQMAAADKALIDAAAAGLGDATSSDVARGAVPPAASPTLSYASGNIVDHPAQVLVNTVNTELSPSGRGVMGAGVAKAFKDRFPSIMPDYEAAIRSGELAPGRAMLFDLPDGRKWAALATKQGWQAPSQMAWVDDGLKDLGDKMRAAGLTSVAIPPPGCGNGGLDWKAVEPLVHRHLAGLDVAMFAKPSGSMGPAASVPSPTRPSVERDHDRMIAGASESDDLKRRQMAAFGARSGGVGEAGLAPRTWSKQQLLAAVPALLAKADGYKAYAGIGSRETPVDVAAEMTAMARIMESRGLTLRSGGADGKRDQASGTKSADISFEEGVSDRGMKEIFLPWKGFANSRDGVVIDEAFEGRAREIAKAAHPGWEHCSSGAQAMHTRNVAQVHGARLDDPVAFVMCWTKGGAWSDRGEGATGRDDGGTGQAIRIAGMNGVPVLNMRDPAIRSAVLAELGVGASIDKDLERDRGNAAAATSFDLTVPSSRSRARGEVSYFCKVSEEHGIQSNMATTPLKVGDLIYRGSENLYQACRFPDHPELQAAIASATPYNSKTLARENEHLTRPDWKSGGVNIAAMAYALTVKHDQVPAFREDLASTAGRDMVELSTRDPFWGAQARGDHLVGQDVLGSLLTQLREGARMEEPPPGSNLPGLGGERMAARAMETSQELPDPSIRASMYFSYGAARRPGFTADTTFEAILKGERTSTTRYPEWGPLDRYERLKVGDVARFFEDKEMRGRHVDVVVTGVNRIDLGTASSERLEDWSRVEGWSVQHARESGRKYAEGVQIRYALPGTPEADAALAVRREMPAVARPALQSDRRSPAPLAPRGQMTDAARRAAQLAAFGLG